MEKRFTDQQINQANSISIIDYAKSRGYLIKKVATNSYKIPGFGGLYIHSHGLKWNRFSADTGGGTIQFVMHMEKKSWVEAVKELLGISPEHHMRSPTANKEQPKVEESKKVFKLPESNYTNKHILAYLIGTRKIDKQLVYDLIRQNKIYENKYYNSCIFVGHDIKGNPKYAAVRGTNPSIQYRKDVGGSDKSYPFTVNISHDNVCNNQLFSSEKLFVFESPIDLMSYLTLVKFHKIKNFEAHCISLGGVCDTALERFLYEHKCVKEITLGLDNDEAGRFACEQIRQKYSDKYAIRRHIPENKDFNEDLIKILKILSMEKFDHKARDKPETDNEMEFELS